MEDNLQTRAKSIINENLYLTLGTSTGGKPWVTPLFFAFDSQYNIYWASPHDSRHSQNIRENPNVSLVCFDSHAPKWQGEGVYMQGQCTELTDLAEIASGLELIYKRLEEEVLLQLIS